MSSLKQPKKPDHSSGMAEVASRSASDPLKPQPEVQKFLISSSCSFTGEYLGNAVLLTHAWPRRKHKGTGHRRRDEGSRGALVLAFRTNPADQNGIAIPDYEHVCEAVCGWMSVLYGKRFDNHGPIESSGFYSLPELQGLEGNVDPDLPQNAAKPRPDYGFPLRLEEFGRLVPLLFSSMRPTANASAFHGACRYYLQALQAADHDLEVAYLHLITAGEILSTGLELDEASLLDAATRSVLARIEDSVPDGHHIARTLRSRLTSIKRRFVVAFLTLIDAEFFTRGERRARFADLKRRTSPGRWLPPMTLEAAMCIREKAFGSGLHLVAGIARRFNSGSRLLRTRRSEGHWHLPRPTSVLNDQSATAFCASQSKSLDWI